MPLWVNAVLTAVFCRCMSMQEREDQIAGCEANLKSTQEAVAAQQGAAQVCVAVASGTERLAVCKACQTV